MAAPVVDGLNGGILSGSASKTLPLTTSNPNDVIVYIVGYELSSAQRNITSITSTPSGLAFTRRSKTSRPGSANQTLEVWWAPALLPLSGESITVTFDAPIDDAAFIMFGVNGCGNINDPWDPNVSLPASSITGSPPTVASYSTTDAAVMVLGMGGVVDNLSYVQSVGWILYGLAGTGGGALAETAFIEYQRLSAAAAGASYTPTHHDAGVTVIDALTSVDHTPTAVPARVTQGVRLAVAAEYPSARATQGVRLAIGTVATPARATQGARLAVAQGRYPARITQGVRLAIARAVDCVTRWCQLWTITRRDGVVFRFTSLDADFTLGGHVYRSCGSLMPSAAEESSAVGSVSSIELMGILADDSIKEADLYGGLFDDAFVEVWLVPFEGTESPRRLAAGWIGAIQHGEQGWTGEVIGPGAKLDQQALVVPYAPACRWTFGDSRCTKDLAALQTTGEVTGAINRGFFVTDAPDPANGSQWENGRVIWSTGRNAGVTCEVKTVDFVGAGETSIELWSLAPFLPEPGDQLVLQPGCDLSERTCKQVYANLINFGGFAEVPGNDALAQTPIAKIDS
jgi:uncharacterized phage protein (TIGR02218 family)